jgi:hypothetical protein
MRAPRPARELPGRYLRSISWIARLAVIIGCGLGCAPLRERPVPASGPLADGGASPSRTGDAPDAGGSGGAGGDGGRSGGTGGAGGPGDAAPSGPVDPTSPEVGAFIGVWEFTQGTTFDDCDPSEPGTEPVMGRFQLKKGADAPLWHVEDACTFRLDVAGATATYRTTPACTYTDLNVLYTITPVSGGIQVGGRDLVVRAAFAVNVRGPGGTVSCRLELDARAIKLPDSSLL